MTINLLSKAATSFTNLLSAIIILQKIKTPKPLQKPTIEHHILAGITNSESNIL